jgi:glutathione synthase
MRKHLIMVMDDIAKIKPHKDTSFAFLLEAQARGYSLLYLTQSDLWLDGDQASAWVRPIEVIDDPSHWFNLGPPRSHRFDDNDWVMMRKDPPVDANYIHATLILDRAKAQGAGVINDPQALRDFNEKLAISHFGRFMPPTCVTSSHAQLKTFIQTHRKVVLKPLDGMGGRGIFLVEHGEANVNAILETLTLGQQRWAMAQAFLPEIADGDKRVLVVNGEIVPYMLARIPGSEDFRGNLAQGGRGEGRPVTDVERAIVESVGPALVKQGILFAGLDVIGNCLTEVNVTSPTCVRELDQAFGLNIAAGLFDVLDRH